MKYYLKAIDNIMYHYKKIYKLTKQTSRKKINRAQYNTGKYYIHLLFNVLLWS